MARKSRPGKRRASTRKPGGLRRLSSDINSVVRTVTRPVRRLLK